MSRVLFSVHPGDDRPIFRQIVEQVKAAVASGRLGPGDRLPTHRDLARDLVVAPLTVKKAYDVLEAEGLVEQAQGRGTFVRGRSDEVADGARAQLVARVRSAVRQARLMGLSSRELRELVLAFWREAPGEVSPAAEPGAAGDPPRSRRARRQRPRLGGRTA